MKVNVLRRNLQLVIECQQIVCQVPLLDHDAFRLSGRSRGIDHISEIRFSRRLRQVVAGKLCQSSCLLVHQHEQLIFERRRES